MHTSRQLGVFAAGLAVGSVLSLGLSERCRSLLSTSVSNFLGLRRKASKVANLLRLRQQDPEIGSNSGVYFNEEDAPAWLRSLFSDVTQKRVYLREWEDAEWRLKAGWHGSDLIHDPQGRGVRVHCYFWNAETLTLTGIVSFGPGAESHRGLCHGGAMTSLMDDLCGHICFFAGPAPWCGATVQVNCKLMKPVHVGDVHKIVGKIYKQETKEKNGKKSTKVFISAELVGEDGALYASLEGLSITPVGSPLRAMPRSSPLFVHFAFCLFIYFHLFACLLLASNLLALASAPRLRPLPSSASVCVFQIF